MVRVSSLTFVCLSQSPIYYISFSPCKETTRQFSGDAVNEMSPCSVILYTNSHIHALAHRPRTPFLRIFTGPYPQYLSIFHQSILILHSSPSSQARAALLHSLGNITQASGHAGCRTSVHFFSLLVEFVIEFFQPPIGPPLASSHSVIAPRPILFTASKVIFPTVLPSQFPVPLLATNGQVRS